ncbi:Abi family protein [Comamonas sp. wu1-DMT]|uniref:Abi family protein n=1 Tax=Comamonas sp. wu1-DMT TaxID=3126390 RepID=UPI0032E47025
MCRLDEQGRKPKKIREECLALDAFRAGTTFQNAVGLYVFDKQLRLLVMDALERIVVALGWLQGQIGITSELGCGAARSPLGSLTCTKLSHSSRW